MYRCTPFEQQCGRGRSHGSVLDPRYSNSRPDDTLGHIRLVLRITDVSPTILMCLLHDSARRL
jgi:hypothetical protein